MQVVYNSCVNASGCVSLEHALLSCCLWPLEILFCCGQVGPACGLECALCGCALAMPRALLMLPFVIHPSTCMLYLCLLAGPSAGTWDNCCI